VIISEYAEGVCIGEGRGNNDTGGDCIMRNFMTCTAYQMLFGWSNQEECD